ncbi:hypothetical protein N7468_001109 [Penicillium chermesinum]|uniref:tRNA-splicing endonuclease subunit Sen15 domain-containing protein n=1 Tax=Penicillium chermesinum TaxID=63820 RepID=A0A9W9TWA1_9EURO|nr:uncharacterized protein N7468_001109 [Penicillium chermesinum]KAJ5246126.1 hypothetical protein N7468_001109 [Penicillium chermesinum]
MSQPEWPSQAPSALSKLIHDAGASGNQPTATTIQVLHNLQHQHLWTSLQIHDISDKFKQYYGDVPTGELPIRSLISGLPPHRVYTHPDEQLYMLQNGIREDELRPERLFVLPTSQGITFSLRLYSMLWGDNLETVVEDGVITGPVVGEGKEKKLDEYYKKKVECLASKEWGSKRILLAMVNRGPGGDGTVVYYVIQEGEVKPRQN